MDKDSRRSLIARLIEANQQLDAGSDNLSAVIDALVGTIMFLDDDPYFFRRSLTRPLWMIANALRDRQRGASSPLLSPRKKQGSGRPTDTSLDRVRGVVAAVCTYLIEGGESRDLAAVLIARSYAGGMLRRQTGVDFVLPQYYGFAMRQAGERLSQSPEYTATFWPGGKKQARPTWPTRRTAGSL